MFMAVVFWCKNPSMNILNVEKQQCAESFETFNSKTLS